MRNIIIGLGAALLLSGEIVAADTSFDMGIIGTSRHIVVREPVADHRENDSLIAKITNLIDTSQFREIDSTIKLFKSDKFFGSLDTLEVPKLAGQINCLSGSLVIPPLKLPDIGWFMQRHFNFGATTCFTTFSIIKKEPQTCPRVTESSGRVSRYSDKTIKEIRKTKRAEKSKDCSRKKARYKRFVTPDGNAD